MPCPHTPHMTRRACARSSQALDVVCASSQISLSGLGMGSQPLPESASQGHSHEIQSPTGSQEITSQEMAPSQISVTGFLETQPSAVEAGA